jgi:hypothetical protein
MTRTLARQALPAVLRTDEFKSAAALVRASSALDRTGLDPIRWTGFVPGEQHFPRAHYCAHQL